MVKSAVKSMVYFYVIKLITTQYLPLYQLTRPQKRIGVKFRDHSRQNIARLNLKVEGYINNHVPINQDVSLNTNNFCNNLFVIYSNCCPIQEKEISFARLRKGWILTLL